MKTENTEKQYYADQFGKIDSETAKIKIMDSKGAESHWMNLSGYECFSAVSKFTAKCRRWTPKVGIIEVRFLGPTNTKGSRVKISCADFRHRNDGKNHSKTLSVDYASRNILDQAEKVLRDAGLSIIGVNEQAESYLVIVEWDSEKVAEFFGIELE